MKDIYKHFYQIIKIAVAVFVLSVICESAHADDDCLFYKVKPVVNVIVPEWKKSVVQPLKPMNLLHGNVSATYVENYELVAEPMAIEDGFCIVLQRVTATVGYNDFLVQIDSRHKPDSCGYAATLAHEDEHIKAHLITIDENQSDIHRAIEEAADAIIPQFIRNREEGDRIMDIINKQLNDNPNIILMRQKIQADQELRNKKIDQREDGARINQCPEFGG